MISRNVRITLSCIGSTVLGLKMLLAHHPNILFGCLLIGASAVSLVVMLVRSAQGEIPMSSAKQSVQQKFNRDDVLSP